MAIYEKDCCVVQSVYDGDGDVSAMVSEMIACALMRPLR